LDNNQVKIIQKVESGTQLSLPPAKPQNLQVVLSESVAPVFLTWDANIETDLSGYQVWRKMNSGSWTYLATVSTNSYTDNGVIVPIPYQHFYYKIRAKDTQNKYSVYSDETSIDGYKVSKSSLSYEIQTKIPEVFSLSQNYPNPFNPTTIIEYSIIKDGQVNLEVFDVLGREVAELVNEQKAAGSYSVEFDASNLPSGIYFYVLTSGSFKDSKKLLLLK